MTASAPTIVDLLRHGACAGGEIFRGVTDSPLTDAGWRQMVEATAGNCGWQHVVSSPLQRCRHFAAWLAGQRELPFSVEPALREIHFGDWEGRDTAAVWREQGDLLERYYRCPADLAPPGGETLAEASARVGSAWDRLRSRHGGKHLLLICHGGTIRLLLCRLLGLPLASSHSFDIPHGCLTRLRIHHLEDGDVAQLALHRPLPSLDAEATDE